MEAVVSEPQRGVLLPVPPNSWLHDTESFKGVQKHFPKGINKVSIIIIVTKHWETVQM